MISYGIWYTYIVFHSKFENLPIDNTIIESILSVKLFCFRKRKTATKNTPVNESTQLKLKLKMNLKYFEFHMNDEQKFDVLRIFNIELTIYAGSCFNSKLKLPHVKFLFIYQFWAEINWYVTYGNI